MSFLSVDKEKCKQDGHCALECPSMLITLNGGTKFPEAIKGAENRCIKCGHCVAVCPQGAISVNGLSAADCLPVKAEPELSNAQLRQLIKSRRSIRNFKSKKVDREILTNLLDIARYAPTGGNSQLVEWLVYDNPKSIIKLTSKVMEFYRQLANSGHPLTEKYNLPSLIKRWESGYDVIFRAAPALVMVHAPKRYGSASIDNTIALSYLDLAASNLGLGTCWAGFFMIAATQSPELLKFLELPEGNICTGALMIGYPKQKYHMIPPRKEAQVIWRN
jgi:nitroreductase/NAD-dependent dihydropyrimidine dehydrogenase PreA subunit